MSAHEEDFNFRSLIEHSSDAIIVHDLEGKILYANPAALALTGNQSLGEVMKQSAFAHLSPDMADAGLKGGLKLLEGESLPPLISPIFLADGKRIEVEVHANLVDFKGSPAIQVHMRDVTHRRQVDEILRERMETERALINFPTDMSVLLDKNGIILNINDNFAKVLGKSPESLLGACVWDLMPPEVAAYRRRYFDQAIQSKHTIRFEENRGDRYYDSQVNPVLSDQGSVVRLAVTGRDITERKNAERQLKQYSENLRRSNEDLEIFAALISHDLQEPVRTIVTYTQLLRSETKAGGCPSFEKYLQTIEKSGLQVNTLIKNLREYSSVSYRQVLKPVPMGKALHRALEHLEKSIHESHASITHDPLPTVFADLGQMVQVFEHLIDNAIKYRKKEVPPDIHISVSPMDHMWKFAVRDNGIGIPSRYFDQIFLIFEQLHPRDAFPGTGLGLALCERIIERHGGQIWVDSVEGEGTTFFFTLKM